MTNKTIKEARGLMDKLYVELQDHLETLEYGSPIYWGIVDKMACISDFMNTV